MGPHRVLHRDKKTFTTEVDGAAMRVSTDRLKPAFILHMYIESAAPPPTLVGTTTRPGWRVCFLVRWDATVSAEGWCGEHHHQKKSTTGTEWKAVLPAAHWSHPRGYMPLDQQTRDMVVRYAGPGSAGSDTVTGRHECSTHVTWLLKIKLLGVS